MQSYYVMQLAFHDSFLSTKPSLPYSYTYGDRPVFEFCFLPNEIAEGDLLVFAVDNDMVFYDNAPENLLHSASCMVVVRHDVTAEEATAGKVQMRIETRTEKFRDVTNGKVRPVEVISGLYRRRGSDDDINYVLLAKGRAMANGIIADYDALPEPITTDEYYTKDEINDRLSEKADEATLVAHTGDTNIHVTLQDKTAWNSKADLNDIGNATVTITQGGETRGSFSVNASENVTIDLTGGGAQADWDETDTTSPSYIQHKPSVYTKTETDAKLDEKADKSTTYTKDETNSLLDGKANVATTLSGYGIQDAYTKTETDAKLDEKADKSSVYTKTETDVMLNEKANVATTYTKDETNSLLDGKADKATTIAGYGITDAYTKTEVDAKVSSVYHYKGTVSAYADLPASGQEVGDVWNIETADSSHGIKAGDNVAWTGSAWDALSGAVDLTPFALKAEAGTDHNHDGTYIPVTGCPLTNFSVEGKRADGSSIGTRIQYTVEDRTDQPVDNLRIQTQRLYLHSREVAFIARPTLGGRTSNQAGGFVISDYNTGDITAPGEFIEGDTKLSDKYAAKSHTHAMGDITGLPASGGTAGQVLTKTETSSEWADLPDTNDYLCFTATQANSKVWMYKNGTPTEINLEYSVDKKNWTEYTWDGNYGATITLANIGDKVWWRGNNTAFSLNLQNAYRFAMRGSIEASGNIMSLLDKTCKSVTIPTTYCFPMLFGACASLTKAPELPATTMKDYCYDRMFYGCSSLIEAPELPATTLAEYCYQWMFYGCSSLTKAPELPATTMVNSCYKNMFQNCTSLTKAPELPATTLAEHCYDGMFKGCTSLREAPYLPATTLAEHCYDGMFNGCSKLNKVKVAFTSWSSIYNWLYGVSSTGVFACPSALNCSTRDDSHVPAVWTIVRTDSPKSITSPVTGISSTDVWINPSAPEVRLYTVSSSITLNGNVVASSDITYAEIVLDVASGATVTAGSNITLVDEITAGKRNICVCRWSGGVCKLYVTIVEDLPA